MNFHGWKEKQTSVCSMWQRTTNGHSPSVFVSRFLPAAVPVLIMLLRALLLSSLSYLVPPGNGILYYSILFRPTKRCTKNFTNTLSFDAYNNRGQALLHQLKSRNQRFTEATKQTSHRRGPGGWSPDVAVFLVISHAVPATEAASLRSCVRSLIQ